MSSELLFCTVEEIALTMGDAPFGSNLKNVDYTDRGALVVQGKNIQGRSFNWDSKRYVSVEKYESIPRSHCSPGDLLFPKVGTIGKVGILSAYEDQNRYILSTNTMKLKVDSNKANQLFIYYYFTWSRTVNLIHAMNSKSVQPVFNYTTLKKFPLELPRLEIQNEVGRILGDLDDKIELNRQTNQTLEQIAQALFKSWFVDFEPTRAKLKAKQEWAKLNPTTKAAGNDQNTEALFVERAAMAAISGKALHELDQLDSEQLAQLKLTAGLFPDGFEESELGEVPVGWEVGELQCIAEFSTDRISVSELTLNNYISTENMLERKQGVSFATSLPSVKTVPHFSANQILISNIRPYFMKIWLTQFEGGRSNDVLGIKARDTGSVEYLYNLLYQDSFFGFMMTTSKGAKMPRGDKKAIMGWMCVHPPKEVKRMYSLAVDKFYQIIDSANKENENLKNIRNTLLPKLLSGELSLEQFQTELETA